MFVDLVRRSRWDHHDFHHSRHPLYSLPPYVLLPGTHRWSRQSSVRLAELAEEPMVLLDLPHSREYFQRIFTSAGVTPTVRYRSASVETCRALVGRGLAYTVLNLQSKSSVSLDGHPVTAVPIHDDAPALSVVLLTAANTRPTRRAQAIAQLCRERLSPSHNGVNEAGQVYLGPAHSATGRCRRCWWR